MIFNADQSDYLELIDVWQASVEATHNFLSKDEIISLREQIITNYFDAVDITCFRNTNNKIIGFCGVHDNKIEMLFITPKAQGQGIGAKLCHDAIQNQNITKVDVNEQNPRAISFYKKMGFKTEGRSELDGEGRPYPILHMTLSRAAVRPIE